ncbi:protein disulfide-isomerase TMX3 isoform X2 [Culicoides brevitarsis]|uniref:protein disulfide-isomerase TMX3 isoform X2 n=1 Tax=Culicoides brevitarsis TaxID=469753 RepID=UPI00307C78A1
MFFPYKFYLISVLLLVTSVFVIDGSKVLELSDKIIDVHHEGKGLWFVMFYAPWCSYCKRLEPIWSHVAQTLHSTNIRVGRLDCTRFTNVQKHFEITGYPTIMFLKYGQEFVYSGERSKDDLLHFVMRLSGPPVQAVKLPDALDTIKATNPVWFAFIGQQENHLWTSYNSIAEKFQAHSYFYSIPLDIASRHLSIDSEPAIIVHKDRSITHFPMASDFESVDPDHLNETLHQWINEERFQTFPKVTRNNLHHIVQTGKYLALVVVEENKLLEVATHELEFKDMVEEFVFKNKHKFHKRFQFGWTGNPDLSHSLASKFISTPHLIVLNATTNEHHLPDDDPLQLTHEAIDSFLESIHNCTATAYGGNGLMTRVYRAYFEAKKSLQEMWRGNPVLTCLIFGLPMGFFSLIVYSIFCADILDAEEETEETHEKKE